MKNACHALLKTGLILDIIGAAGFAIAAAFMILSGGLAAVSTEEELAASGLQVLTTGTELLFTVPAFIVGTVLAKKGLAACDRDEESVGLGVCILIFTFIPAGILYIVRAVKKNETVTGAQVA